MSSARPHRFLRFSLRTFLLVTLALSLTLGIFGRYWLKAWRDSQPPTLYELAQIAKRHGIPMPPKGAKLVLARTSERWHSSRGHVLYTPAFLLSEHGDGTIVLCGDEELALSPGEKLHYAGAEFSDLPVQKEFSLDEPRARGSGYVVNWESQDTLICALQLAERGEIDVGQALLQRWIEAALRQGVLSRKSTGDIYGLREEVRQAAFRRMERQLWSSDPKQWPALRDQMSRLLEESESLRGAQGQLLADVSATVDAPPARPGSVEALLLESWPNGGRGILRRGFNAVPELIRLCDDRRYVVGPFFTSAGGKEGFLRIGDVADESLSAISGSHDGLALSVEMPDEQSDTDAKFWNEWWRQAQVQGEREYCVRNFFACSGNGVRVRHSCATVLRSKYPDALTNIGDEYLASGKSALARSQMSTAIRQTSLPTPTKVEMLANLAKHGALLERRNVLHDLMDLDAPLTAELLTQFLDEFPADAKGIGLIKYVDITAQLQLIVNHSKLVQAYIRAAHRNVDVRMELISRLAYWYEIDDERLGRVALLAAFLEDDTPRDCSFDSNQDCSAEFPGITVRDFAAMHIAKLLDIDVQADKDWTSAQWSALREHVRERLKGEELPALE